ncbi:hypothetical protein FRX31_029736 [Thalictrum thalictroides]|uniref:Uncharacterized protein n=1 Tax=Thalictrum thalictroides TaxID=46969 RepID=A0A7J6V7D4_THATH|nr:hypothetical protein FRX31_029736 [Thalictrum thalictroides]
MNGPKGEGTEWWNHCTEDGSNSRDDKVFGPATGFSRGDNVSLSFQFELLVLVGCCRQAGVWCTLSRVRHVPFNVFSFILVRHVALCFFRTYAVVNWFHYP